MVSLIIFSFDFAEIAFILVNGAWHWPAKYVGYDQFDFHNKYQLLTLSLTPPIFYIPNLLNSTEAQAIIELANVNVKLNITVCLLCVLFHFYCF